MGFIAYQEIAPISSSLVSLLCLLPPSRFIPFRLNKQREPIGKVTRQSGELIALYKRCAVVGLPLLAVIKRTLIYIAQTGLQTHPLTSAYFPRQP